MIKIKDYIFNDNEIDMFNYHRDTDTLQVINTINNERLDTFITNTTFEDIEWNYGSDKAQISLQNQLVKLQQEKEELKEEYITLEKDYGTSEIENDKLRTKIKQLEEENHHIFANVNDDELLRSNAMMSADIYNLNERINKAIEYIGNGNLGIPRKTREKFIKILKGEENE